MELGTRAPGSWSLSVRRSPSPRPWLLSSLPSPFGSCSRSGRTRGGAERAEGPGSLAGGVQGGTEKPGRGLGPGPETDGNSGPGPTLPPPLPSRSEPEHPARPRTRDPLLPQLHQGPPYFTLLLPPSPSLPAEFPSGLLDTHPRPFPARLPRARLTLHPHPTPSLPRRPHGPTPLIPSLGHAPAAPAAAFGHEPPRGSRTEQLPKPGPR